MKVNEIGQKVMVARVTLGYSQRELAIRTGLSRGMITNIETGTRLPSFESLTKIAMALGYDLDITFEPKLDSLTDLKEILG